jgi:hypothetical protein
MSLGSKFVPLLQEKLIRALTVFILLNLLIIHEENTKKNHKLVVSLYVIEISLDLHKL